MAYLFLFGRNPELSAAELLSYLARKKVQYHITSQTPEYYVLEAQLLPETAIRDLGGTVVIAEHVTLEKLVPNEDKIRYALTTYGRNDDDVNNQILAWCREHRVKAVRKYASSKKHLPTKWGQLDYVFFACKEGLFLARHISQPKEYKKRDETRPMFDPLAVTSIRLAKMLINLTGAQQQILDPFCGAGTILQEALLMGYDVVGIDTNITATRKNLNALGKKYTHKIRFHEGRAEDKIPLVESIEAVVTEPYMGPYLKKLPTPEEAKKIIAELTVLYTKVLKALALVVTGRIVIIIPRLRTFTRTYEIPMERILREAGLQHAQNKGDIPSVFEYHKQKSKVERTIYVLERES